MASSFQGQPRLTNDLDFVGLEVQDWLTLGLQETGLVRVYAATRSLGTLPPGANNRALGDDDRFVGLEKSRFTVAIDEGFQILDREECPPGSGRFFHRCCRLAPGR